MVSRQDFHNLFSKNVVEKRDALPSKLNEMGVSGVKIALKSNYLNTVLGSDNYLSCSISVSDASGRRLYKEKKQFKLEPEYSAFAGPFTLVAGMPKRLQSIESAERQLQTEALEFAKELEGQGIKVVYNSLQDLAYHLQ
jgi:hypothetical protein